MPLFMSHNRCLTTLNTSSVILAMCSYLSMYSQAHGPLTLQVGLGSWVWTWKCEPRGYTWTSLSTTHHTMGHEASCRHTCKYNTKSLSAI